MLNIATIRPPCTTASPLRVRRNSSMHTQIATHVSSGLDELLLDTTYQPFCRGTKSMLFSENETVLAIKHILRESWFPIKIVPKPQRDRYNALAAVPELEN
jgi:hypothetical protein